MSHPTELARYLTSLPFLGRTSLSHSEVTAGEWIELLLIYEVGAAGLADGAWLKVAFKFYSDWGLFQTSDPTAPNYISAEYLPRTPFPNESPATVRSLKVRFDQKGHERPYQKAVIVDVVDGYLKPGDRIVLRLGDRRHGSPGTRAQTFVEEAFRFRTFVDTVGASRFAPVPGDLQLKIVPGPSRKTVLITPRRVKAKTPFSVTLRHEDAWGNLAPTANASAKLDILASDSTLARQSLDFASLDRGWSKVTVTLDEEGDYRLEAGGAFAPLHVAPGNSNLNTYFADLHIHSEDTVGVNTTAHVLAYARDAAGLDIAGYTANDFNVSAERWHLAVAECRRLHHEGTFLCFPGTEWCGASAVGGDRNVIFLRDEVRFPLDAKGRSLRVFDWNEDTAKAKPLQADVATAAGLHDAYRDMAEDDRVLLIPHVGGRRALFEWHDRELERLVEVASSWGHFDWFYREALARGLHVGASAAGDEHRGRPGGGAPGVGSFGVHGGLTGVIAEDLTSISVSRALRARRTWATTGQRAVALLSAGDHLQGDCFEHHGPLSIRYDLHAAEGWEWIEVRDDQGEVIHRRSFDAELGLSNRRLRVRWGGARIRDRYRWAEWRGVIKVSGAHVEKWTARGLEHPEETLYPVAPGHFVVRSDTYGDADHLEMTLDDLRLARFEISFSIDAYNKTGDSLARNPDPITPGIEVSFEGAELIEKKSLHWDIGGVELFLAVEPLTEQVLPHRVIETVEIQPTVGPHSHRAFYVFGRERDDAKIWTSPLFVQFKP